MAKISLSDISSSFQTMITQNLEPSTVIKTQSSAATDNPSNENNEDKINLMDKIALEMQRGV